LRKAEERERLRRAVAGLEARLSADDGVHAVVAESAAMRAALDVVARVAAHRTTVLITGESGTGKEVIARAIHHASPRAGAGFVGVNCAAIPETLLESELFGHVRGAFTGATADRPGLFEQADGGTLLLDEIGELPLALQAKLLRVLQEGEIRRVGAERTRRVDARVLAATARDLQVEVTAGRFREDLFYRLNVVTVHLPPLRERPEDIPALVRHFVAGASRRLGRRLTVSAGATGWLAAQPWPGNARELEHTIERAAVLSDHDALEPEDFRPRDGARSAPALAARSLRDAVDAAERDCIAAALASAGGNRRDAATRLGVSLRTLFYKIARHGLE
jgi:two-component system response regulator AtoC